MGWKDAPLATPSQTPAVSGSWRDAPAAIAPPQTQQRSDLISTLVQGINQGATGGYADEIGAGITAAVRAPFNDRPLGRAFSEEYANALRDERGNLKVSQEQNPVTSGVSEVGGALAPVSKVVKIGSALKGVPGWLRMIGAGAGQGALYASGTADTDKANAALAGGVTGAVLGPAVGVAAKPILNVGMRLGKIGLDKITQTPRTQAERELAKALQTDLADPEAVARLNRMEAGSAPAPMVLADVGENTAGLARGAAAKPGPFRTDAQATLTARQEGQQGRLLARMPTTPNSGTQQFKDSFDDWAASRITSAKPLYDEAYAASFNASSPQMKALLQKPAMRDALREAERQIGNEAGIKGGNVQRLDLAKRVLDDNIGEAQRKGRGNEARMLMQIKTDLLGEMDRQVPQYAAARQAFAGEAAVRDAGSLGSDLFSSGVSHDEARRAVSQMTDSENQAFRRGALRSLVEKLEQTPESRNAAGKLTESIAMRDKLKLLFKDPAEFERFIQTTGDEAQMTYTKNKVLGGSPTARIMEETKALGTAGEVLQDAVTGNKLGLFGRFLRTLGVGEISKDTLQELSDLLLKQQSPQTISRIGKLAGTPPLGSISPRTQLGMAAFTGAEAGQQ